MATGHFDIIRRLLGWLSAPPSVTVADGDAAAYVLKGQLAANVTNEWPLYGYAKKENLAANVLEGGQVKG